MDEVRVHTLTMGTTNQLHQAVQITVSFKACVWLNEFQNACSVDWHSPQLKSPALQRVTMSLACRNMCGAYSVLFNHSNF